MRGEITICFFYQTLYIYVLLFQSPTYQVDKRLPFTVLAQFYYKLLKLFKITLQPLYYQITFLIKHFLFEKLDHIDHKVLITLDRQSNSPLHPPLLFQAENYLKYRQRD